MIKAIFQSSGVESNEHGKKGVYKFTHLSLDGKPLTNKYSFNILKKFKELKLKKGDVVQFEAEVDFLNGLKIKYPKNITKVDLSHLAEGYEYCINKYLKESRVLSTEDAKNEKLAYVKMATLFNEELFKFISLPFRLNSLHWFLTEDGQKFCREQQEKMERSEKMVDIERKSVKLEKNKVGEDVLVDRKKQTLMGFLK